MDVLQVTGEKAPPGFVALGSDARLTAAAQVLCRAGWVQLEQQDAHLAAFALLGVPTADLAPHRDVLARLRPGTLLFAGAVSRGARLAAAALSLPVIDYMDSEELALFNAIPTAEGAVGLLLAATPDTLWQARVLLLGYGRISQALLPRLLAFGARVTVAARSGTALARAAMWGGKTAAVTGTADDPALAQLAADADLLVNTAPALLVTRPVLEALPKHAFVLDLASAPGGVDLDAARQLGIGAMQAGGLPGKWAPAAAGRAVGRTVLQFLRRHGPAAQPAAPPLSGKELDL